MRRFLLAPIAAAILLAAAVLPASAITGGQPDGDGHPYGALILVPGVTFCSGTLIDENVVLTAGHCTWFWSNTGDPDLVIDEVLVTFDTEAAVDEDWMPIPGEGTWYTSDTWFSHPDYVDEEWPFTYDYGVVILDQDVTGITPANLPYPGELNDIAPLGAQTSLRFNDVGYGQSGVTIADRPYTRHFDFIRRVSTQRVNPGDGSVSGLFHETWFILQDSPSDNHGAGCGGDSGSGIFPAADAPLGDTVVAVHTGGYRIGFAARLCGRLTSLNHRVDLPVVLDWLAGFTD